MEVSKELSDCVNNLQAMQGEIDRMCKALDFAYNEAKKSGEEVDINWHVIMGTLSAGIVLRGCAFQEEIDKHFLKHYSSLTPEIEAAIGDLHMLLSSKSYKALRDTALAHNNRLGGRDGYKLLTYDEISRLVPPQHHTEYMRFGEITSNVRTAIVNHFVPPSN